MKKNPFQQRYYVQQVLENLKQTERAIYDTLMLGRFPKSVKEILENVATTFLPPTKLEQISIAVLTKNGRLADPTEAVNIRKNTDSQILKRNTFQAVLLNIIQMYEFYRKMFAGNAAGFQSYVRQGCFTSKFTGVLLECNPATEKMNLLSQVSSLDYFAQVQFYLTHNNEALKRLFILRNISNQDVFVTKRDNATIFDNSSGDDDNNSDHDSDDDHDDDGSDDDDHSGHQDDNHDSDDDRNSDGDDHNDGGGDHSHDDGGSDHSNDDGDHTDGDDHYDNGIVIMIMVVIMLMMVITTMTGLKIKEAHFLNQIPKLLIPPYATQSASLP